MRRFYNAVHILPRSPFPTLKVVKKQEDWVRMEKRNRKMKVSLVETNIASSAKTFCHVE